MKRKTDLDFRIEATTQELRTAENAGKELTRKINYLILQSEFAIDRYKHYRTAGDLVKELQWDELNDYVESLINQLKDQRSVVKENESKLRDKLIDLLHASIDTILQPFRELEYHHSERIRIAQLNQNDEAS